MKASLLLLSAVLFAGAAAKAQSVTTVTGLRLYEHHSPDISGPRGANGFHSGYDFVSGTYHHSFDSVSFGAFTGGQEANIDMVEHNGPYGNGRKFGITSGVSSIWGGDIKGNGTTKWMMAPSNFSYAGVTDVSTIAAAYNAGTPKSSIDSVMPNTTYLARIRNTALYVAMQVTNVKNRITGDANVYFDFEYKYGTLSGTGIEQAEAADMLSLYPNPAPDRVTLNNTSAQRLSVRVIALNGQLMQSCCLGAGSSRAIDISHLGSGLYFVTCTTDDGRSFAQKLVKQ